VPVVMSISVLTFVTWLALGYSNILPASWVTDASHGNTLLLVKASCRSTKVENEFLFAFLFSLAVILVIRPLFLYL
jgi:hypothetical protein